MEMSPELTSLLTSPIVIGLSVASVLAYIVAVGLAMKMALACTAPETPSLMRATYIAFIIPVVQIFLTVMLALMVPPSYAIIVNLFVIFVALKMLATMADISVFRAIWTNFVYGFFGLFTVGATMAIFAGAFYFAVYKTHPIEMRELASLTQSRMDEAVEARSRGYAGETGESSDSGAYDITSAFFSDSSEDVEASDSTEESDSVPQPAWEPKPQVPVPQTGDAPAVLPLQIKRVLDTSRQQANPFVK